MFGRHNPSRTNNSVIGSFFDWPESPFRWKTLDRADPFRAYKFTEFEPPKIKDPVIQPLKPSEHMKTEKKSFDDLVIRVNPIKFPAKYLEPKRNFIPSGRGALPRTPTKTPQSPTDEELDKKSEELRRIEDSLLRSRNELPRTPILPPQKPDNSKKIELPLKKEVGIQTGGILTVKQKSTQNYIPSGRHQLRRSAKEPRLRGCDVDIEVIHDDLKVSKMNWRGTSQISLRIQPQTPKIPESSNEPVFDTMFGKKTLKPIKSTTSGVLMVLMDK